MCVQMKKDSKGGCRDLLLFVAWANCALQGLGVVHHHDGMIRPKAEQAAVWAGKKEQLILV